MLTHNLRCLLAPPQGGVAASSKKCCEATKADAAGVVFLLFSIGKPPRPRVQRRLRGILLIARPPLLAVMQVGEYARFQFIHIFIRPPLQYYSTLINHTRSLSSIAQPMSLPAWTARSATF